MFSLWRIKKLWIQTLIETSLYQHQSEFVCQFHENWGLWDGRIEKKNFYLFTCIPIIFASGTHCPKNIKQIVEQWAGSFNGMTWKMCPNPHRILLIYLTQIIIARIYRINQTKTIFTLLRETKISRNNN